MSKWYLILSVFLFVQCKTDSTTKAVDSKPYISSISNGVIKTSTNGEIILDTEPGSKVFYLVRHAEKDTIPKKNPVLTPEGYARAAKLAEMLKPTRIDQLYSTFYNRTYHTVDSISTAKGLKIKIYTPKNIKTLAEEMTQDTVNQSFLIVGHSNTTPAFASVLMGEKIYEQGFDESDYDNFLVVNFTSTGEKKLHHLYFKPDLAK